MRIEHVPAAAQAEREAEHRRRDPERDHVGQRIEIGAEHGLPLLVEPRDVAVEDVADERRRQQDERGPEKRRHPGRQVVETQKDRDGPAGRIADREEIGPAYRTESSRRAASAPPPPKISIPASALSAPSMPVNLFRPAPVLMVMKRRLLFPVLVAVLGFCSPRCGADHTGSPRRRQAADAEDTREDLRAILRDVSAFGRRDPAPRSQPDGARRLHGGVSGSRRSSSTQHPEIPRNVEFYFEGFGSWQNPRRLDPSFEALGVLLGGMAGIFVRDHLRRRRDRLAGARLHPASPLAQGFASAGGRPHQVDGAHDEQRGAARLRAESRRPPLPRGGAAQAGDRRHRRSRRRSDRSSGR